MTFNTYLFYVYAASIVIMSIASFIAFYSDKQKAIKGKMRTKEKTLLCLTVLNGAIGSFIGRIVAHHKTDKKYFSVTIYFALLCQLLVGGFLAYMAFVA